MIRPVPIGSECGTGAVEELAHAGEPGASGAWDVTGVCHGWPWQPTVQLVLVEENKKGVAELGLGTDVGQKALNLLEALFNVQRSEAHSSKVEWSKSYRPWEMLIEAHLVEDDWGHRFVDLFTLFAAECGGRKAVGEFREVDRIIRVERGGVCDWAWV